MGRLKGRMWLNSTYTSIQDQLRQTDVLSYLGEERAERWLPIISGFLVYGLVLVPLFITTWCLTSVQRFVCRIRPCLLFCHLYLAIVTGIAAAFAAYTERDPLQVFAMTDEPFYQFQQAVF